MDQAPRILIVSRRPSTLAPVVRALDTGGLCAVPADMGVAARLAGGDLRVAAVLIDLADIGVQDAAPLAGALRKGGESRPLTVALASEDGPEIPSGVFDLVIRRPCLPDQIRARLHEALRLGVCETEARLRRRTLAELGVVPSPPENEDGAVSILFVGYAAPAFMALRSALSGPQTDMVAAFTSFTAFDYLHERTFHAVVLSTLEGNEPAFTICSAMRRNSRLFHVPTLLLVDPRKFVAAEEAFARGASDLLCVGAPAAEMRDRVLGLAESWRRSLSLRAAFDQVRNPTVLDRPTGLFRRDVFAAHLRRMADWAEQSDTALSLTVIRVQPSLFNKRRPDAAAMDAARRQFGQMLRHLTRGEDFAARLDSGVFVIAMPATPEAEARAAAARIRIAAECASYDSGKADGGVRLALHVSCAQLTPGESAGRLLKRAVEGLSVIRAVARTAAS